MKDCFTPYERKLFLKYGIRGSNVECVYPVYFENLCYEPMSSLNDMIPAGDLKDTSNELLLNVINIIEKKLDNSNRSNIIKHLFKGKMLKKDQWNVLIENGYSNETIEKYFGYQDEPVWFYCICFV